MALTPATSEEEPHIAALRRAVDVGFQFKQLADDGAGAVAVLYAERWSREGVIDTITMQAMNEAIAARIRIGDYPQGDPVWQRSGSVAEVVAELLALPAHGSPGAPTRTRPASSSLWLPGAS